MNSWARMISSSIGMVQRNIFCSSSPPLSNVQIYWYCLARLEDMSIGLWSHHSGAGCHSRVQSTASDTQTSPCSAPLMHNSVQTHLERKACCNLLLQPIGGIS